MVRMNQRLARIVIDPNICFGKACIRGTRIWVSLILDFLASGMTNEDILAEYPQLEKEDIQAALAYGAEMARDRYVEIPTKARDEVKLDENSEREPKQFSLQRVMMYKARDEGLQGALINIYTMCAVSSSVV